MVVVEVVVVAFPSADDTILMDSGTRNGSAIGTEQRTKQAEYFKFQFSLMIVIPPGTRIEGSLGKYILHQTLLDFLVCVAPKEAQRRTREE